ncbi:hypothetical protein D3C80_442560 [compost metagenome]
MPPSRLPLREKTSKCDRQYDPQRRAPLDGNAFEPFLGGLFLDEFLCLHPMACEIQNARFTLAIAVTPLMNNRRTILPKMMGACPVFTLLPSE